MEVNEQSSDWTEWIRLLIGQAIASNVPDNFGSLLRVIPGLPPDIAYSVLRDLAADGEFVVAASRLATSAQLPVDRVDDPIDGVLLRPHPLDHEWRFDLLTRRRLSRILEQTAGPDGHIVALGCPTVAYELVREASGPRVTLIDANHCVPTLSGDIRYTHVCADLRLGLPTSLAPADVIVADPPFYPDDVSCFIAAASGLVRTGGRLYLALLSPTTRPSAEDDIAQAVALARDRGWVLLELQEACLGYHRPRFEWRAHAALGLHGVPDDWRRADLYIFERTGVVASTDWPWAPVPPWEEVILGLTRVRVLASSVDADQLAAGIDLLEEVVPGGVLDSVSSRDPRRALANVWTDGNVVWATRLPSLLLEVLRAAAAYASPLEAAVAQCELEGIQFERSHLEAAVADVLQKIGALN